MINPLRLFLQCSIFKLLKCKNNNNRNNYNINNNLIMSNKNITNKIIINNNRNNKIENHLKNI